MTFQTFRALCDSRRRNMCALPTPTTCLLIVLDVSDGAQDLNTAAPSQSTQGSLSASGPSTVEEMSPIVVASTVMSALVGGGLVTGLAGLTGSGGTALGSDAFPLTSFAFEQTNFAGTAQIGSATAVSGVSLRKPSATLTFVVTSQLQFLATLSLVDYAQEEPLKGFLENYRWTNLWWSLPSVKITKDATACEFKTRQEYESILQLAGNLVLFFGLLFAIYFIRVAVASGMEAQMILKRRAVNEIKTANNLSSRRLGGETGELSLPLLLDSERIEDRRMELGSNTTITHDIQNEMTECRDKSSSVWLHFPHLELVFLLFAFQGVVASLAQVIHYIGPTCLPVFYTAIAILVLYSAHIVLAVSRTVFTRVLSDSLIDFRYFPKRYSQGSSWLSRVWKGWEKDRSFLAWANGGQWQTVETTDETRRRQGNWFRIGFEPLFVDFTKAGAVFVIVSLLESVAFACVGALIDESARQLLIFCAIHIISFSAVVTLKPFANAIINILTAMISAADVLCMGLMALSESNRIKSLDSKRADLAVVWIQLTVLCVAVIPIYVDTAAGIVVAIRRKLQRSRTEVDDNEKEVQALIRRYTRAKWIRTWFIILRYNIFACARKTRGGRRRPLSSHIGGKTAHIPPMGPEVNSDNGLPIVNENSRIRWNRSARRPIANDIPHRRTYHNESAGTSPVMDAFSQGATVGGQAKQDVFSPRGKRISSLPNDLPRRRTFNVDSIKDGDLVVHDVPPPSDTRNDLQVDDLPRRRTFDVESLKHRQGCLEQDDNDCKSEDGEDPIPYTDEKLAARARGTRWGFDRFVGPIAEEHPRRAVGYRQDLGQLTQGRSTTDPVVFNPRKETPTMQRHRWNEPFMDDVPRRRQYNSTLDDTEPVQVDVQGNKRGFLHFEENSLNVHRDKPHSLRNVDPERSAGGTKILLQKVRRKGKPVMSDIPRRRSMQSTGDAKWSDEINIATRDFDHGADPINEESTTRLTREDGHFAKHSTNDQVGEPGSRWRLKSTAPLPVDIPRPRVGYQQKQLATLCRNSEEDTRSMADRASINDQPHEYSRRWGRKGEPLVSDLPRRRSFCVTKCQIEPSSKGVASGTDRELDESQRNKTTDHQPLEVDHYDVLDYQCSPDKAPTKHVDNNDDDNHGAQDLLHVRREVRKGNIISHDFPRRRSFRLDGAATKRKAQTMTSSSGVYVDYTRDDWDRKVKGAPPQVVRIPLSSNADDISASRGMESHRSFNAPNAVQSTAVEHSHRMPGGRRGFGNIDQQSTDDAENFQNRVRLKRTPIISDIPRRHSNQSAEEARCSARIAVTSYDVDRSTDPNFEGGATQQAVEEKYSTQGGVLDSRWKLNTPALFPMDLPRLNVGHQKGQLGAKERDTDHQPAEFAKHREDKREPLVIDLTRRRSSHIATSERQNELVSMRGMDNADQEPLENVQRSVFNFESSPNERPIQTIETSTGHGVYGFVRTLLQTSERQKGHPAPIEHPRRRHFCLDDPMAEKVSLETGLLSGVCVDEDIKGDDWTTENMQNPSETISPPLSVRELSNSAIGSSLHLGPSGANTTPVTTIDLACCTPDDRVSQDVDSTSDRDISDLKAPRSQDIEIWKSNQISNTKDASTPSKDESNIFDSHQEMSSARESNETSATVRADIKRDGYDRSDEIKNTTKGEGDRS